MAINGFSRIPGGQMENDIHVNGIASITNPITCNSLVVNGILRSTQDTHILGDLECNGIGKFRQHLQVEQNVRNSGMLKISGQFYTKGKFDLDGTFRCGQDCSALQGIHCSGLLRTKGTLHSEGVIQIHGRLKAFSNVIAEKLLIIPSKTAKFFNSSSEIIGDIAVKTGIELEKTVVHGTIQARTIIIKQNCKIYGPIYYVDDIDVDPSAVLTFAPQKISEEAFFK